MKLSDYIRDKIFQIIIFFATFLLAIYFMVFTEVKLPVIIAVSAIMAFGIVLGGLIEYFMKKPYYDQLLDTLDGMEEKTYLTEIVKKPEFYDGKIFYKIIRENGKYMNDKIAYLNKEKSDYNSYVETWVHEVKIPIATAKLLIANNKNEITLSIEEEVDKIEEYAEQIIYYNKSSNLEQDYNIKEIKLKDCVLAAVKKNSKMMISQGIMPKLTDLELSVLSDSKWLEFIIGQIVSNSIKYKSETRKPEIVFRGEQNKDVVCLYISDNGIGIPQADLQRVLKKGFTGENGRRYKKSTGIGLYLCDKLCRKMGISISLESIENEGTTVKLELPKA